VQLSSAIDVECHSAEINVGSKRVVETDFPLAVCPAGLDGSEVEEWVAHGLLELVCMSISKKNP
jgi:hypothetical protein